MFLRSPGGSQLARAATLLSCLQFGAALLFMTVHDRMFQRQCLGFSGAKLRSKRCQFGWDRRLPAREGAGIAPRADGSSAAGPPGKEACGTVQWRWASAPSSAPQAAWLQGTGAAETFYASINCPAVSVVFPVSSDCWLLYLVSIIKLLQPENFQQQKTKLPKNIIEVNVRIVKENLSYPKLAPETAWTIKYKHLKPSFIG